jgi:hypothetical protein
LLLKCGKNTVLESTAKLIKSRKLGLTIDDGKREASFLVDPLTCFVWRFEV